MEGGPSPCANSSAAISRQAMPLHQPGIYHSTLYLKAAPPARLRFRSISAWQFMQLRLCPRNTLAGDVEILSLAFNAYRTGRPIRTAATRCSPIP